MGSLTAALAILALLLSPGLPGIATACSVCRSGDDRFFLNGAQRLTDGSLILMGEYFSTGKTSGLPAHGASEEATSVERLASVSMIQHAEGMFETHDQQVLRFLALYGLTEDITVLGTIPYALNRIEGEGVTGSSNGFADPELTAIMDVVETEEGDFELNATVMTRLPLGNNELDGTGGNRLDQHLQPGTGAWGAAAGFQAAHPMWTVPVYYGVSYQINASNAYDFSYGDVLRVNVATQIPVGNSVRILTEGNLRYASRDEDGLSVDENSGGWVLYLSPGLRVSLPGGLAIRGQVQLPVWENLYGIQDEKPNVQVGLSVEP